IAVEPTSPPSSLPPQTSRRILRDDACCGRSPGLFLPALTFVTRTGRPKMIENATAVLRICPPPSPYEPSISSSSIATPPGGSKKNQSVDFPDLLLNIPREPRRIKGNLRVGLLVGRFQPFHYGHLAAVKYALKRVDYLYIVVGSAQRSHERDNPFTAGERIAMIKGALDNDSVDGARWMAIPISDADSHSVWVSTVKSMVPRFDVAFTNDSLTFRLFEEEGLDVKPVPYLKRGEYSATNVRTRILERRDWGGVVPFDGAKEGKEFGGGGGGGRRLKDSLPGE